MRALLAIALAACSSTAASHEPLHNVRERNERRTKPSLDEARAAIEALDSAAPYLEDREADTAAALAVLGVPLWFDGFHYSGVRHEELLPRCTRASGTLYSHDELKQLAECLVVADWRHSDLQSLEEVTVVHFPKVFHAHRARLEELAADHLLAYSHFCPAAPGDFWTLFAVGKDSSGRVVLDAILVFNEEEADCRTEDNGGYE